MSIPIKVNGRIKNVSEEVIARMIKQQLLDNDAIQKVFADFEVAPERLDELQIEFGDLKGKYAETDLNSMVLDQSLFADGLFFDRYMYVPAHEIIHWLSRIKEQDAYFNDPEETLGFVTAIAFELSRGKDIDDVWNKIYDKIAFHFHNEVDARQFFENMLLKAKSLLRGGKI